MSITSSPTTRTASRPDAVPVPERRQVPVLWLALLATPISAGANSPVLILPDMAHSFSVSTATAAWLVSSFAWAMAIGTPLLAGLLRRRGVRPVLRLSGALVLLGTILVAVSPWLPLAMAGRAAQAAGGAGLATTAMSLAGTARRMGVITAGLGMLGAAGPLLASQISGALSWRLALAVSALALPAIPAVARYAPDTPRSGERFDGLGALLLTALATALVLLPTAWPPALAGALAAAVLLGLHMRRRPDGFVPSRLLRTPVFLISALLALVLATLYFLLLFAVPRLLESRADWSAGSIGVGQLVALLIGSALSWVLAASSSRMSRSAVRAVVVTAGALAAVTAVFASWGLLLLAVAAVAVFAATGANGTLSVHAATSAPERQRPTAIGLFTLCYQLGGAFGPAIATLLVLR